MKHSLPDIGDGEELIDLKLGGVHSRDSQQYPFQVCLQLMLWVLAF